MKPKFLIVSALLLFIALGLLLRTTSSALAIPATSPGQHIGDSTYSSACTIHVNTEEGGDIDVTPDGGLPDGVYENVHGAIFWNGLKWVTNNTAAHMYFTCVETGQRIKNYTLLATLDGSGSPGVIFAQEGYTVTQNIYNYTVNAADLSGNYQYQAVEYSIDTSLPDEKYILRSRGTGNGTSLGYLDIYIQRNYTYTVAFRGDPVWYKYDNTTAQQAVQITSDTQGRFGFLSSDTPVTRAQYWLDINGGSDMGGVTYYFRTSQLAPVLTMNLGSSFPTEFRIKFMDGNNQLEEFIVLPRVVSEKFTPGQYKYVYLPLIIR
jgi:hypothetical protein